MYTKTRFFHIKKAAPKCSLLVRVYAIFFSIQMMSRRVTVLLPK